MKSLLTSSDHLLISTCVWPLQISMVITQRDGFPFSCHVTAYSQKEIQKVSAPSLDEGLTTNNVNNSVHCTFYKIKSQKSHLTSWLLIHYTWGIMTQTSMSPQFVPKSCYRSVYLCVKVQNTHTHTHTQTIAGFSLCHGCLKEDKHLSF